MERHEVHQLVQGIPVATTVLTRSPVIWSQDNNIAIVTQHGTYILELSLSPDECSPAVMFTRYFIPILDGHSLAAKPGIDIESVVIDLENNIPGQWMMLDEMVSAPQRAVVEQDPKYARTTLPGMPGGESLHRGFSRGAWSPPGLGENGRCILGLSTRDHRLVLCMSESRHWVVIDSLTEQWFNYNTADDWKRAQLPPTAPAHSQYATRITLLAITQLLWTPLYEDKSGKYSFLMTLMGRGCLVFWRVESNFPSTRKAAIFSVCDTNMTNISAAHWHSLPDKCGYLIVGNSKGEVLLFFCDIKDTGADLRQLGCLWESADLLSVRHLHMTQVDDKRYLVIFSKHNILVVSSVCLTNASLSITHTSHTMVGDLEVSGIIPFENHNLFVSSKDGLVKHIRVHLTEDGDTGIQERHTLFNSDEVMYSGLACSPNKALFAVFEMIKVAYDHLVEREPTLVNIYRVGDATQLTQTLLHSQKQLYLNADIYESLRICLCKGGDSGMSTIQPVEIPDQPQHLLKAHYWLVKISKNSHVTDENNLQLLEEVEPLLQTAIMCAWICNMLKKYLKCEPPKSPAATLSLALMCSWTLINDPPNIRLAESVARRLGPAKSELCPVCSEEVPLDALTHGCCSNGHTLPRCCRTLLLTEPNIICPYCKVFAHKDSDFLSGEGQFFCTYCNGFMKHQLRSRK